MSTMKAALEGHAQWFVNYGGRAMGTHREFLEMRRDRGGKLGIWL
jgi:hypothetical protein